VSCEPDDDLPEDNSSHTQCDPLNNHLLHRVPINAFGLAVFDRTGDLTDFKPPDF
jgi:hypothetical protein